MSVLKLIYYRIFYCIFVVLKRSYSKIIVIFDQEGNNTRIKRKTLCVIYIVFSLILVPFLMYVIDNMGLYVYVPR